MEPRYAINRKPRRAHRGGLGAVMLVLMGLAGMAHAVDDSPRTAASATEAQIQMQAQAQTFIAERVVDSPTWESGYTLIEGIDDYGYGLVETTPNGEVAGERVARFEDYIQLAER